MWPSGKALVFGINDRRFESCHPSFVVFMLMSRSNPVPVFFGVLSFLGCMAVLISSVPFQKNGMAFPYKIFLEQVLMVALAFFLAYSLHKASYVTLKKIFLSLFLISSSFVFFGHFLGTFKNSSMTIGSSSISPLVILYPSFPVLISSIIYSLRKVGEKNLGLIVASAVSLTLILFFFLVEDLDSAIIIFSTLSVQVMLASSSIVPFTLFVVSLVFIGAIIFLFSPHAMSWLPDFWSMEKVSIIKSSVGKSEFLRIGSDLSQIKYMVSDPYGSFFLSVMNEDIGWSFSFLILSIFSFMIFYLLAVAPRLKGEKHNVLLGVTIQFCLQVLLSFGVSLYLLPGKYAFIPFLSHNVSSMIAGGLMVGLLWKLCQLKKRGAQR